MHIGHYRHPCGWRSRFGYDMARCQCHMQNCWKASAKCKAGSFVLLVQSLIAKAPGHRRKLQSDTGLGLRRWCKISTSPWGVRCVFNVKCTSAGSMINVRPLLLCLITVLSKTFGFSLADLWLPYLRYASKFSFVASALQSAGAPLVRILSCR